MTAASGTARTARPWTWDGPDSNRIPPHAPAAPVPRCPMHRAPGRPPQGRLRRRPSRTAGLRPVLDPPARSPRTPQLSGKQETPSHARPAARQTPAKPPLTRPHSFRDDTNVHNLGGCGRSVRRAGFRSGLFGEDYPLSAVDEFTCRVEVTGVGCRLSDHMQQDLAQVAERRSTARAVWGAASPPREGPPGCLVRRPYHLRPRRGARSALRAAALIAPLCPAICPMPSRARAVGDGTKVPRRRDRPPYRPRGRRAAFSAQGFTAIPVGRIKRSIR